MLEEFTNIYDIHRWARYATWIVLLSTALLLVRLSGGIPPSAWRLLPGAIQHLPQAWAAHGPGTLFALMGLALLSLVWLLAWGLLLWASLGLLWHYWNWTQREREMARMLAHGVHPPLRVLPVQKHSPRIIPWPLAEPVEDARGKNHSGDKSDDGEDDLNEYSAPAPLFSLLQQLQQKPQSSRVPASQEADHPPPSSTAGSPRSTIALPSRPVRSLEVGVGWHVGKERQGTPNEDNLIALQGLCTCRDRLVTFGLFVVADGMGGHSYGQEASSIAIQTMLHTVVPDITSGTEQRNEPDDEWFIGLLVGGVEQANQAICQFSQEKCKEMGTTLTAALIFDAKAYVVNVGDSRTYLYRRGVGLSQITQDHSLVAQLVASGEIKPDEVYTHPKRNQVYRAVGNPDGVEVDWFALNVHAGDRLLLCSDGLWEMVRDPMISSIMSRKANMTVLSEQLVHAALAGGGADNVSVIVAEVV